MQKKKQQKNLTWFRNTVWYSNHIKSETEDQNACVFFIIHFMLNHLCEMQVYASKPSRL